MQGDPMTVHLTARLAWHMNGWNGHICQNPAQNRYCIGAHSYPGDKIRQGRDLDWERDKNVAGRPCSELDRAPPCIYSINAFGRERLRGFDDPPDFFPTGDRTFWELPPATVCVWPYEAMYEDRAKTDGRVDNDKRLELAKVQFSAVENDKSLVFHYANYSNPFSEEEAKRYVVVGLSRIKKFGNIVFYDGTDEKTKKQFGGAYVWQMNVVTHYPDQGLCIPYHRYLEDEEVLKNILFVPDKPRNFKYGSRQLTDDDALSLAERFVEVAGHLKSIGDDSENWSVRLDWLNGLVAELWHSRGLYPGLARVLDLVGLSSAVGPLRKATADEREKEFKQGRADGTYHWRKARREWPGCQA
jgi:exodeoxyribonuclease V alpha subunit